MARVKEIYQFRVSLAEVRPPVWRCVQVRTDCTLARLHKIIQAIMDWQDCHLHEFNVGGRNFGVPDLDDEQPVLDERLFRLRDLDISIGDRIEYLYDFGDNWQHLLGLEDRLAVATGVVYPVCIGGECSAPPEDVGGVSGYEELLEALSDPGHDEYEQTKAWLGRPFDPRAFSIDEANERLRKRLRLGRRK
jgi:hypothetical protein